MARGKTRGHKGGRKQFSNPDQIKNDQAKMEEKRLWREQHPDSDSETESEEEAPPVRGAGRRARQAAAAAKQESPSASAESSSSEEESDDEGSKKKGVEGMIDIENPNRVKKSQKKVTALDTSSKPQLSRYQQS